MRFKEVLEWRVGDWAWPCKLEARRTWEQGESRGEEYTGIQGGAAV